MVMHGKGLWREFEFGNIWESQRWDLRSTVRGPCGGRVMSRLSSARTIVVPLQHVSGLRCGCNDAEIQ